MINEIYHQHVGLKAEAHRMMTKPMKPKAAAPLRPKFSFSLSISYNYDMSTSDENEQVYTVVHELNEVGDQIVAESWYQDGELSRANGPAHTTWSEDTGQKLSESWYVNGKAHRRDGPAYVVYVEGKPGMKYREEWAQNDQLYRIGGPAKTAYDPKTGEVISTFYHPKPHSAKPSP
ncbi:hypothetical protein ACSSV4_004416 [Roseovarius sp. MBR-154]